LQGTSRIWWDWECGCTYWQCSHHTPRWFSIRRWKLEAQASEAFYRIVTRPAPPRGCAVTISIPPIVYLVRDAIAVAFHLPHPSFLYHPRRTLAALIFGQLAVTVGEEPGWRASRCPDWSAASVPDLRNAHARKCMGLLASTCLLGSWHSTVRNTVCSIRGPVDRVLEVMTLVVMRTQSSIIAATLPCIRELVCPSRYGNPTSSCSLLGSWLVVPVIAGFASYGQFLTR